MENVFVFYVFYKYLYKFCSKLCRPTKLRLFQKVYGYKICSNVQKNQLYFIKKKKKNVNK